MILMMKVMTLNFLMKGEMDKNKQVPQNISSAPKLWQEKCFALEK